jgi:hypothetical protein
MEKNGRYSGQFRYVPGQPSEIRINSLLVTFANAQTCLDNTLLHEMVHQYVEEVEGGDEWAHGLKFFIVANRLGAELNLSFCSQDRLGDWPDHVDAMLASFQGFSAAGVLRPAPFYRSVPQRMVKIIPGFAGRISQRLKRTERWPLCLW